MIPQDHPKRVTNETAHLFAQVELEARDRSRRLEAAGRLPAGFTHNHYPETSLEEAENRRQRSCWYLATDLASLRALLAGEAVPRHRLNQEYLGLLDRWPR